MAWQKSTFEMQAWWSLNRLPRYGLSVFVFVVALWLYSATAVPGLIVRGGIESESAELQRAAYRLGIAHSTGYPIHTLIGHGAGQLGTFLGGDPYTWITYSSALASAIALVIFLQLALRVSSPPAALAATFLLGVTNTLWHLSTITETQALHLLTGTGLFWGFYEHQRSPKRLWPLILMALMAGMGLANHRTTLIHLGAVGAAGLIVGAWRQWTLRRWLLLILLVAVPVASYGYLFIRAQDPHVVFSTRPTPYPAELTTQDVVGIIQGKLQNGQGAEINLEFPRDDFSDRLIFVTDNVVSDVSLPVVVAGLVGLALLAVLRWRMGVLLGGYLIAWVLFLMSWRLDWKATIYQHVLLMPLILGVALLASPGRLYWRGIGRFRVVAWAVCAIPVFAIAVNLFLTNYDVRDLSGDNTGERFWTQFEGLPSGSVVYPGGWAAETFILLEYLDESGRKDIEIRDSRSADDVLHEAQDATRSVYITPFLRGLFGLYGGSTVIAERDMAFSGTGSDLMLQIRPPNDPRVGAEARQATIIEEVLSTEISLYSYQMTVHETRIDLTLYWLARETSTNRYSVYTHLRSFSVPCDLAEGGRLLAQDDAYAPVDGTYTTAFWNRGEFVKDTYLIPWVFAPGTQDDLGMVVGLTLDGVRQGEFCIPLPD